MNIEEYNYDLPQNLIAQTPLKNRSDSKLLVMDKKTGELQETIFRNIIDYLNPGDILVLNDTKVIPARLIGEKEDTHAVIELLLLKNMISLSMVPQQFFLSEYHILENYSYIPLFPFSHIFQQSF